ncbi:MAG: hypothetical protein KDE28_20280 [Anaerolineales bacterium]|nr:hypothetical protein [Anaerolineales bacterium]
MIDESYFAPLVIGPMRHTVLKLAAAIEQARGTPKLQRTTSKAHAQMKPYYGRIAEVARDKDYDIFDLVLILYFIREGGNRVTQGYVDALAVCYVLAERDQLA